MKAKLLKDTPDIKAGAIFSSLTYNTCTKHFIDGIFDGKEYINYLFYFYDDLHIKDWSSLNEYQMFHIELVKSQPDWFQIIKDEENL